LPKASYNNPFANKSPGSGRDGDHGDSPYPVAEPRRDSMDDNYGDDGPAAFDEPSYEEVTPS